MEKGIILSKIRAEYSKKNDNKYYLQPDPVEQKTLEKMKEEKLQETLEQIDNLMNIYYKLEIQISNIEKNLNSTINKEKQMKEIKKLIKGIQKQFLTIIEGGK